MSTETRSLESDLIQLRYELPALQEVYCECRKNSLRLERGRIIDTNQIVRYRDHLLKIVCKDDGRFLILLFEMKFRTKRPFWELCAKCFVESGEEFYLSREGFFFSNGAHVRIMGRRRHSDHASFYRRFLNRQERHSSKALLNVAVD